MPVTDTKTPTTDWPVLLKDLRSQAKARDEDGICSKVKTDLNMSGNAKYEAAPEGSELVIDLPAGGCLVFLIMGKFTLDDSSGAVTEKGLGHVVEKSRTLTLAKATAVVIISGY